VLLLSAAAAVFGRWQSGHWPQSEFYLLFMLVLVLVPIGALIVVVPQNITLTEDSLTIGWPFRRTVSDPLEELEYFSGRIFHDPAGGSSDAADRSGRLSSERVAGIRARVGDPISRPKGAGAYGLLDVWPSKALTASNVRGCRRASSADSPGT
jgi:hypothetical protein